MVASRPARADAPAAEAWRAVLDYFVRSRDRHLALAADHGLTVAGMKTLLTLDPTEAKSMRALADEWKCDASNVTWLVDRLEERGLVERRPRPSDRRVKTVALTPAGQRLRDELLARIYEPPEEFSALPAEDHHALRRIFAHLAG